MRSTRRAPAPLLAFLIGAPIASFSAGCVSAEPGPMAVTDFGPRVLPAALGGDVVIEGTGLVPRRVIDLRTGAITVLSDDFLLLLDDHPCPVTRGADGRLAAHVADFPLGQADARDAAGVLHSPTGAEAPLPAPLRLLRGGLPAITAIDPVTGPPGGGLAVTVHGADFHAPLKLFVGAAAVADAVVTDRATIHGTLPPGAAGASADVRVVDSVSMDYAIRVEGFVYSK